MSEIPDRPNERSPEVLAEVVSKMLPEVLVYLEVKQTEDDYEEQKKEVAEQLVNVLKYDSHDGYELVKDLERMYYWEGSAELVDIMSGAWSKILSAVTRHTQEWVKQHGIQPKHKVDDEVEYYGYRWGTGKKKGKIAAVYPNEGRYVIQEEGSQYQAGCGAVIEFERVIGDQAWYSEERHTRNR